MKIKTNDTVKMLSGKDKGKSGKILQVFVTEGKVVVEGVNKIKKHLRARTKQEKGQIIELSSPVPTGKVALVCPKCSQAARVGFKIEAGKKKRMCRKCGQFID